MSDAGAGTSAALGAKDADPVEWDETKIRASLARIEQLQTQLDTLRTAIPSVTAAAAARNPSKQAYFANFSKAAMASSQQVADFNKDWVSQDTQEILVRARKSREEDPNMAKAVDVPSYGWIEEQSQNA